MDAKHFKVIKRKSYMPIKNDPQIKLGYDTDVKSTLLTSNFLKSILTMTLYLQKMSSHIL